MYVHIIYFKNVFLEFAIPLNATGKDLFDKVLQTNGIRYGLPNLFRPSRLKHNINPLFRLVYVYFRFILFAPNG